MKISNLDMNSYLKTLHKLSNKVNGKLAYCVARNIRKIGNELIEFENVRNNYIREHGKVDSDGNYYIEIDSDEYVKFADFINEFMNIEHDVDIMMADKEDVFNTTLNANEILELDFMIKEDAEVV